MSFALTSPPAPATGSALLSHCQQYRYLLHRTWDRNLPLVAFIMLNPSTAHGTVDDPTIRRCVAFAKAWGAGGLSVRNLYALRATDPQQLLTHADPVGPDNDHHLLVDLGRAQHVVVAWGAHPAAKPRAPRVELLLRHAGLGLQCLGTTQNGSPRHPLYVAAATVLQPYQPPG